jgi:hypothetical protein
MEKPNRDAIYSARLSREDGGVVSLACLAGVDLGLCKAVGGGRLEGIAREFVDLEGGSIRYHARNMNRINMSH